MFFGLIYWCSFLAKKRSIKLKITDKKYKQIREYARDLYLPVDASGNHLSNPKIAKLIEAKFYRKVNPETIRNWMQTDNWEKTTVKIVEKAEKQVEHRVLSEDEKILENSAFLADMIKVNNWMWKKATKLLKDYLSSDALDVKDSLFLLKFTTDNKLKFEEFKINMLRKQVEVEKERVELERNQVVLEKLKKELGDMSKDDSDFSEKFIGALKNAATLWQNDNDKI